MNLINEDLARAHISERQREADEARVAYGLLKLRRAHRRAAEARLAAKRALDSLHLSL